MSNQLKTFLLFVGDAIALYAALFLTLIIRYQSTFYAEFTSAHAAPFTIIFIAWLVIFYIAGLYDLRRLRNNFEFLKTLILALAVNAALAILFFYAIPLFGIAPKTNLFIVVVMFAVIEILWRRFFNRVASSGEAPNKILLVGNGTADAIAKTIGENVQLGYAVKARMEEAEARRSPDSIRKIVEEKEVNLIVFPRHLKNVGGLATVLYELFGKGILVMDLTNFYELIMRKVPLSDLEESWFLENIENAAKFYEPLKEVVEFFEALVLGIVLIPLELLIAMVIKLTSRGPVIYKQTRVGKNGREFTLYKFRSMMALSADGSAETKGVEWAKQGDKRTTPIGNILRKSHLDELPQLINIIRGELSFVGPRPERPEWVKKLKEQIPYYEARLFIKPGVTGWAQISHRADLDVEDVKEKLQYDLYYLKNRSVVLDIAIILKTAKSIFINPD